MSAHGNSLRDSKAVGLTPFISPLGAWALSLGSSIGWGSFVITSNTYLAYAGPFGSGIGMLIGACIILIIARNYHFLMNRYPDSGGVYSYTRQFLGYDYAFLTVWFLSLTYLAVLWANATSLPLFARYFLGYMFQAVPLYQVFGYQVYLGETLLTICVILVAGLVCACFEKSPLLWG